MYSSLQSWANSIQNQNRRFSPDGHINIWEIILLYSNNITNAQQTHIVT